MYFAFVLGLLHTNRQAVHGQALTNGKRFRRKSGSEMAVSGIPVAIRSKLKDELDRLN